MANDPRSGSEKNDNDNAEYVAGYELGRNGDFLRDTAWQFKDDAPDKSGYEAGASDRAEFGPTESGGGGCFLTTACVASRGLPDNCLELTILRRFRDSILLPSSSGKRAVVEYYHIAPEIVNAINSRSNAKSIWDGVYSRISKAVELVRAGRFNDAFKHYKETTTSLKREYL